MGSNRPRLDSLPKTGRHCNVPRYRSGKRSAVLGVNISGSVRAAGLELEEDMAIGGCACIHIRDGLGLDSGILAVVRDRLDPDSIARFTNRLVHGRSVHA
jgi:hypothetical protein